MTRLRILAALCAVVLALAIVPATAQEELDDALDDGDAGGGAEQGEADLPADLTNGARFIATGDGGGFDVQLAEERLTVGLSQVGIQSSTDGVACDDNLACATAAGETLLGETAEVGISEGSASDAATALDLDALEPLIVGGIGDAEVSASVEGGVTRADARGGALDLQISLTEDLLDEDVLGELEGLVEELLGDGLDQEQLDELIGELDGLLDLEADEIGGILEEAGLAPGAQTQTAHGDDVASPDEIARELVDAHERQQGDAPVEDDPVEDGDVGDDPVEDGEDGDVGDVGDDPVDDGDAQALQDAVDDADGDQEDVEDVDGVEDLEDAAGDGNGDGDEPDADAIAALIEDLLGDGDFQGPEELLQALQDLIEDPTGQALARVALAPTSSEAEDADGVTSAWAGAQGLQLVLLPAADSTLDDPNGLVSLQVGAATASVSSDRSQASADFDPALARLRVTNPLTGEVEEVSVEPGQSECVGAEPLELCISVGHGDTTVENGGASASANAVSLTALGDPLPQLSVDLAAATAAVNAADVDRPDDDVEPRGELPVTGGGFALPGLVLLGAGAVGFAGLRRRG